MALERKTVAGQDNIVMNRLTNSKYLATNSDAAESGRGSTYFQYNNGYYSNTGTDGDQKAWMWRRQPGFFDVVAYEGNGQGGREVSHNLGVKPEAMWVKCRSGNSNWTSYWSSMGAGEEISLNLDRKAERTNFFLSTEPESDVFTLGGAYEVNGAGEDYIAYLFASVPGISKVGSYTGTGLSGDGSFLDIDCGFTNGARWLLAKRTDGVGDWWMTTGSIPNAPLGMVIRLNDSTPEVFGGFFSPIPSGFRVAESNMNTAGQEYIYYAIA